MQLQRGCLPADRPERLVQLGEVPHHEQQLAEGEHAGQDMADANEQHRGRANRRGHSHDQLVRPFEAGEAQLGAHRLSRTPHEALLLALLLSERFDDAQRTQDLLHDPERVAVELLQRSRLAAQAWAEEPCRDDQSR